MNIFLVFALLRHMWTVFCLCIAPSYLNIFLVVALLSFKLPFLWTFSLLLHCYLLYEHFLVFAVVRNIWIFSLSLHCSVVCDYFPCFCIAPSYVIIFLVFALLRHMSTFFFVFAMLRHIWTFSLSLHCSLLYERFYEHFPSLCSDLSYVNIFLVFSVLWLMWIYSWSSQSNVRPRTNCNRKSSKTVRNYMTSIYSIQVSPKIETGEI